MLAIFGLLTMGSIALSSGQYGVDDPSIERPEPSVRSGSSHRSGYGYVGGGGSRVK